MSTKQRKVVVKVYICIKCFPRTLSTFLKTTRRATCYTESLVSWALKQSHIHLFLSFFRAWFKKLVQHHLTNQSEQAIFSANQERNNILANWIFPRLPPVARFSRHGRGDMFLLRADWLVVPWRL